MVAVDVVAVNDDSIQHFNTNDKDDSSLPLNNRNITAFVVFVSVFQ